MMGVGSYFKIKIVSSTEQTGVDGIEPLHEEIANPYAEVEYVSQTRGLDANKANYKTTYIMTVQVDSAWTPVVSYMVEFNNHFYSLQSIDRGNKGRNNTWISNPNGRWWRLQLTSQDIN